MLLPYWTNNCVDSMEGLFFESSATTPYHLLDQAELSVSPSNPQVGLDYGTLDVAEGVEHLQMLGRQVLHRLLADASSPKPTRDSAAAARRHHEGLAVAGRRAGGSTSSRTARWSSRSRTCRTSWRAIASRVALARRPTQAWWLKPSALEGPRAPRRPRRRGRASRRSSHARAHRRLARAWRSPTSKSATQSISFHVSRVGVPGAREDLVLPALARDGRHGSLPREPEPDGRRADVEGRVARLHAARPALELGNIVSDAAVVAGLATLWFAVRRRRNARK